MGATVFDIKTGSAATGNVTVTKPTGTANGNLLYALAFMDPDGSAASMTASGFTQVGSTNTISGVGFGKMWRKAAGGSEPASYTFGGSGSATSVVALLGITGHDPTTPVAASANGGSATASANHVAPSISPAMADTLLLCGFDALAQNAGDTYTLAAMAELADVNAASWLQMAIYRQVLAASGASGTRTATLTASKTYLSFSVAIAPAPASAQNPRGAFFPFGG